MSVCRQAEAVDMACFADHLANSYIPNKVIIGATAMSVCRQAEPVDMARFADHLANSYIPNTVIIDATASEAPPALYLQWMQKGIHIITPNKKLGSGPLDQYLALRHFQRESYIHFFYEVSTLGTPGGGHPRGWAYILRPLSFLWALLKRIVFAFPFSCCSPRGEHLWFAFCSMSTSVSRIHMGRLST